MDSLNDLASAKKRAEDLLQEELRKKKEVLEANDLAVRSEEKRLTERIEALENHVGEKDKLLRTRDTELSGFAASWTSSNRPKSKCKAGSKRSLENPSKTGARKNRSSRIWSSA